MIRNSNKFIHSKGKQMNKIMYVDTSVDGHHLAYLSALIENSKYECIVAIPKKIKSLGVKQYIYKPVDLYNKKLQTFLQWMKELSEIAKSEKVSIVHFLMGDDFYKYFGIGLGLFRNYKTIATVHWVRPGCLKRLSLAVFSHKVDIIVVHSEFLYNQTRKLGIRNSAAIEYPQFKDLDKIKHTDALKYWGLDEKLPVLGCIGGTRYDKGLDILLDALKHTRAECQLLVCGKPDYFDESYIQKNLPSKIKCVNVLRFLSDEEVDLAVEASDYIVLPYRKSFNGASGPLGEGVSRNKCIIGPKHGNLGYTINRYQLGYTFISENAADLTNAIDSAIAQKFVIRKEYKAYQKMLNVTEFKEKYNMEYDQLLQSELK